jgi:hypothetical protein
MVTRTLVTKQFGFSKWISTENAAFRPTGSVLKYINHVKHVGEICCILAEAFDCVIMKVS